MIKEIGPFKGRQKPVRDGVYKRTLYNNTSKVWCLFSKGKWYCSSYSYRIAKREVWPSAYQELEWWGRAKK